MKIIVILVVLLALAGGGAFGLSVFAPNLLPPPVAAIFGVEQSEEPVEEEPQRPTNTTLVDIEPITIPLFADGDVDRFLIVHLFLEVESGPNVLYVNGQMTRIVDAIITHVHALAVLDVDPGIQDRAFLKERLFEKINETIGDGYVVDILFQNLFERPLG